MEGLQIVPSSVSGRFELGGLDITSGTVIELLVFNDWQTVRIEHLDGLGYCAVIDPTAKAGGLKVPEGV